MKRKITAKSIFFFLLITMTLYCTQVFAASPKINNSSVKLSVGGTKTVSVTGLNKKQKVAWSSNKPKIAAVNKNGKITAKSAGSALITATVDKKTKYTCTVTVNAVNISTKSIALHPNESHTLSLYGLVSGDKVSWTTSNKNIVSVSTKNNACIMKGIRKGSATITGKCNGKSYKCSVKVEDVKVKLNDASITLLPNQKHNLKLIGKNNGSYVGWNSSNIKTATVTAFGEITAKNPGTATIKANYKGRTYSCRVTVKDYDYSMTAREKAVYNKLISFQKKYPEGMIFTNSKTYEWKGYSPTGYRAKTGHGCAAFAFELSDAAFGNVPAKVITAKPLTANLHVGDLLVENHAVHTVIILKICKADGHVIVAEANVNDRVHWGRKMTFSQINNEIRYVLTRY